MVNINDYVLALPYRDWYVQGFINSLILIIQTVLLSVGVGVTLFLSIHKSSHILYKTIITLLRNTPPVPLLLFVIFSVPSLYKSITGLVFPVGYEYPLLVAVISCNGAAYIAEIIRSGYNSIPDEQISTAQLLGFSESFIRLRILLPQAIQRVLPTLKQRLIHIMKNSSIAIVVPLVVTKMEIMGQASRVAGQTFAWIEPLLVATIFYIVITMLFELIFRVQLIKKWDLTND